MAFEPVTRGGSGQSDLSEKIEVNVQDSLGHRYKVSLNPEDTVGDLKKLLAAECRTRADLIGIRRW